MPDLKSFYGGGDVLETLIGSHGFISIIRPRLIKRASFSGKTKYL